MNALTLKIATYACAAVFAFLAGMGAHKMVADRKIAGMQRDWAQNIAAATAAREKAEEDARATEHLWQQAVDDARKEADDQHYKNALLRAQVASMRAPAPVDAGLRGKLETARLAGQAAGDAAASCNARAGAYETALAEGDRVVSRMGSSLRGCRDMAAEGAQAHDDRAVDTVTTVNAWPK